MEPFQDEPVRIVVTAGGIPQPAMRDKAAFRHALLTDNEKACVCHDIIRIGVEVAFHAVYLDTLADITRNYSIIITLFGQIPVMGIGGTVTQEHGTLHVPLDGTLVRGQREERLGLPITKGLVNLLGGSISVSSHVGEGSLFHTEIPLAISTEPVKNHVMPTVKRLSLPKRIILVDDDPIQLRIVMEMLERNGVSCRTCIGAKDVVGELRKEPYDLLLTDIQMHGTSGFDLLYLLRHSNIGNSRTIPVAAMTARNDVDESRYTEAGFSGCIQKPFSMNELQAFLSSIMERSGQRQEQKADFNALAAETGDMEWMLNAFIEESIDNRTELKKALESMKTDTERMKNTLHRMYPTWEQLGVACELETYSRILHDDTSDDLTISTYTETVIGRIDRLVGDAKNLLSEIRKLDLKNYTDETQNTHS